MIIILSSDVFIKIRSLKKIYKKTHFLIFEEREGVVVMSGDIPFCTFYLYISKAASILLHDLYF
jgi:ribonuclease BN (tRNA processing enzyme)